MWGNGVDDAVEKPVPLSELGPLVGTLELALRHERQSLELVGGHVVASSGLEAPHDAFGIGGSDGDDRTAACLRDDALDGHVFARVHDHEGQTTAQRRSQTVRIHPFGNACSCQSGADGCKRLRRAHETDPIRNLHVPSMSGVPPRLGQQDTAEPIRLASRVLVRNPNVSGLG